MFDKKMVNIGLRERMVGLQAKKWTRKFVEGLEEDLRDAVKDCPKCRERVDEVLVEVRRVFKKFLK